MAHARQLLNILEDEQPPAAPTPEAKPNTNFPGKPELEKKFREIANLVYDGIDLDNDIGQAMQGDPELMKELTGDDDEMMAHNDIKLMVIKLLGNG